MLNPAPSPVFSIAPGLDLTAAERRAAERAVASLTGEVSGAVVTDVRRTDRLRVVELATVLGTLVVVEQMRVRAGSRAAA